METQSFTLQNRLEEIEPLQEEIECLLQARGVRLKHIQAILLALGEWLENVILHAYGDTAKHLIVVDLSADEDEVRLCVSDDGADFELTEVPGVDQPVRPGHRAITGHGIRLIRSLMDHVEHQRRDEKNQVTLIKQVISQT